MKRSRNNGHPKKEKIEYCDAISVLRKYPPGHRPTDELREIEESSYGPIIHNVVAVAVLLGAEEDPVVLETEEPETEKLERIVRKMTDGLFEALEKPKKKKRKGAPADSTTTTTANPAKLRIDVIRLAMLLGGQMDNSEFAAPCLVKYRHGDFTYTASILATGKIIITGGASEPAVVMHIYALCERISTLLGIPFIPHRIVIHNMQAVVYMSRPIDLESLKFHIPSADYVREKINRVKYSLPLIAPDPNDPNPKPSPRVTCCIYPTGSCVLTGAKERRQFVDAMRIMVPYLAHFTIPGPVDPRERKKFEDKKQRILQRLDLPF